MSRRDVCEDMPNLKICKDTYALRREAMDYVYEAGELCELPFITVRITEESRRNPSVLGRARYNENIIWIPEKTIEEDWDLRSVVYHEILHTVFHVEHIEGDPLMGAVYQKPLSKREAQRLFKKHCPASKRDGRRRRRR